MTFFDFFFLDEDFEVREVWKQILNSTWEPMAWKCNRMIQKRLFWQIQDFWLAVWQICYTQWPFVDGLFLNWLKKEM